MYAQRHGETPVGTRQVIVIELMKAATWYVPTDTLALPSMPMVAMATASWT
jgi:hypothetical protein